MASIYEVLKTDTTTRKPGFFSSGYEESPMDVKFVTSPMEDQYRPYLERMATRDIQYPTRKVSGMTEAETKGQSILGDILAGKSFADPRSSPLYHGLREESLADEEAGAAKIRRMAQAGGMLRSTPATAAEGAYRSSMARGRASILGDLYEKERDRDNEYTRLAAANQYGSLPRLIQEAQNQADYEAAMQNLLAPYQLQAPILSQLANQGQYINKSFTQTPSIFEDISSVISTIFPILQTFGVGQKSGGGGGSGSAMGAAGVSGGSQILSSMIPFLF